MGHYLVGGRLGWFAENWRFLGCSNFAYKVITKGYKLPFRSVPKLTNQPIVRSGYANQAKQTILLEQVEALLMKGAIEEVRNRTSQGFYSRLFVVPKHSGGWRPVIDLSTLNRYLVIHHFKMETPETVRLSLRQGQWSTSIDLTDAYLHLTVHPRFRKYLRFHVGGKIYQFKVTPFGLATIPGLFTSIVKEILQITSSLGMRLHAYLDDILISEDQPDSCDSDTQLTKALLLLLGWVLNVAKSSLVPSQIFPFVGYGYNLKKGIVFPLQDRIIAIQSTIKLIQSKTQVSARELMALLGLLTATEKLVHMGRLHMRPIQWYLKDHWNHTQPLDKQMPVLPSLMEAMAWWVQPINLLRPVPLHKPTPQVEVYTDASTHGWGGHCLNQIAQGVWSSHWKDKHINVLEMKAVLLSLQQFVPQTQNKVVMVRTDNTTVLSYITRQGGTHSRELDLLTHDLFLWADQFQITLQAQHIAGIRNVVADQLSRSNQMLAGEWSLHQQVMTQISQHWFPPEVDLFATRWNAKLPKFVSPIPDPKAWKVDAMSFPWSDMVVYLFPPSSMMNKVVQKLALDAPRAILIAPWWPAQPWWQSLVRWSVLPAVTLPIFQNLLRQPITGLTCPHLEMLQLHAWFLEPGRQSFQPQMMKWRAGLRLPKGFQPEKCMKQE